MLPFAVISVIVYWALLLKVSAAVVIVTSTEVPLAIGIWPLLFRSSTPTGLLVALVPLRYPLTSVPVFPSIVAEEIVTAAEPVF